MKSVLILENYRFGKSYLRKAKEMGYETILATYHKEDEVDLHDRPFIDHYVQIDIENFEATVDKIVEYYNDVPFDGALAGHVFLMPQVAAITDRLELPSFGYEAACNATYKDLTRKLVKEAGLFPYDYYEIQSMDDLKHNQDNFNYPCIMKPVDGFASINIFKTNSFDELRNNYFEHLNNIQYGSLGKSFSPKVLVEEFINGSEYSVESVVEEGKVTILAITEKVSDPELNHIEIGHIIPASNLDRDQDNQLRKFVEEVHKAIGVKTGVTHTEVKIDGNRFGLMEINPRVGGGYIADMLGKVIGKDMYSIVIDNCIGRKLMAGHEPKGHAYIRFIRSPKAGKLVDIKGVDSVTSLPEIQITENRYDIGSEIKNWNDNRSRVFAYVGFHDSDVEYLKTVMSEAEKKVKIVIE
ncbi:ATP-grasp domain-containing protein [Paenibacillus rhizophilus]|nr:ATP-grasp domain-containing protein [Paenibacillus rhizophilus]